MGKTKHMLKEENKAMLEEFETKSNVVGTNLKQNTKVHSYNNSRPRFKKPRSFLMEKTHENCVEATCFRNCTKR